MSTRTRSPVLVLILALSPGCAGDSGSGASEEPSVPVWTLEQEGRIGSLDDPDQLLDDVDQVVIGPDEQLFVPQDNEILVFDPAGIRTGTIGREGEGPGEFLSLRNIGLVGDTLYAVHGGQVSRFTLDGRYLTSRRLAGEQFSRGTAFYLPSSPMELVPVGDGGALATPNFAFMLPDGSDPGVKQVELEVPVFRFGADLELQDTVVWQDLSSTDVWVLHGGETYTLSSPWDDYPLAELMPSGSGVVVLERSAAQSTEPSTFRTTLIDANKDTLFSTPIHYGPVPVHPELLAQALEEDAAGRPGGPTAAEREEALRDADLIPAALPPVTTLAVGQDGTIWIKREETLADPVLWQVLGPDGKLVGELHLPNAQTVLTSSGDLMVAVELDDLDVPYIVRYRIVR